MAIKLDIYVWENWNDFIFKEPDLFLYMRKYKPHLIPTELVHMLVPAPTYYRIKTLFGNNFTPYGQKIKKGPFINVNYLSLMDYEEIIKSMTIDKDTPYISFFNPDIFTDYDLFD